MNGLEGMGQIQVQHRWVDLMDKRNIFGKEHILGGNRSFCLDGGEDEVDIGGHNENWMDNVNCE
jgi:hypothetical protein